MKNHLLNTYARTEFSFDRGEGCILYGKNPKTGQTEEYLDFGAGIAVLSLGHAHPYLVAALTEQAQKLWHTSNLYKDENQEKLSMRLCQNSFADLVFFTNSGAESNECAFKMARRYHYEKGNSHKVNIISFEGAFHGRTLATIAAGGQEKHLEGFAPKAAGFIQVPFEDWDAMCTATKKNCAAIILEPIQGEGGLRPFSKQFLVKLRKYCDENDILLIFDEIQTGIGRTGTLFAYETYGVEPDIMSIAKGIGGGFPVGACLAIERVGMCMTAGSHGSTYGGNPLAMAVGNAVLDVVLADGFLENVRKTAGFLNQKLLAVIDAHPTIFEDLRGEGLLIGIKCKASNIDILNALYEQKMLAVPAGNNVLRILPPLIATIKDVELAMEKLTKAAISLEEKR